MKIITITDVCTRRAGGVFNAVRDMFTNKTFKNVDFEILSYFDDAIEYDFPLWRGVPLKLFKPHFFLYSRKLRDYLLSSNADLYHQEGLWRYSHLLMGQWGRKIAKPIICTPHGMLDPFIIKEQGKIKRIISNLFFQKSLDSVTCYQALCKKEMEDIRAYGQKQPIAIIPNGINLPDYNKKYDKVDNQKHLLFLGRLHAKKGVDLLLEAIVEIKTKCPSLLCGWHIDLVGWDHENCRKGLERFVVDNDLEDIVTFHGGLYDEDKERMYANCDAYILPSHGEGLPMTVLEAWAWAKPVLITPQCHLPEGYDSDAAIRIEDNKESVAAGLEKLFSMSDMERHAMGERGLELVKEKFTWDAAAKQLIELYNWVLGKTSKPSFVYL